jgi:DNA-binding GntR family transcriptional regulator
MIGVTKPRDLQGKAATAHDQLKRYAIEGLLRSGRHLSANELEDHFGISATPIRDALVRLAAEGFLTWEPSRGFYTNSFLLQEQRDLHEILLIAVPACWDWTSGTLSPTVLEAARSFQERCLEPGDVAVDGLVGVLEDLFMACADATNNRVLIGIARNALERTRLVRLFDLERTETRQLVAEQLVDLIEALSSRNASNGLAVAEFAFAALKERLPALVDQANLKTLQSRFP